jgi:hypothetical protein
MCKVGRAKDAIRKSERCEKMRSNPIDCNSNGNILSKKKKQHPLKQHCIAGFSNKDKVKPNDVTNQMAFNVSNKITPITKREDNLCLFNCMFQSLRTEKERIAFCNNNKMHPIDHFNEITKDLIDYKTGKKMNRGE